MPIPTNPPDGCDYYPHLDDVGVKSSHFLLWKYWSVNGLVLEYIAETESPDEE